MLASKQGPTTAVGLVLAALFLIPLGEAFEDRFPLALSVMTIVHVYDEYWSVTYSIGYEIIWTIVGGIVTIGIFIGVYELPLFIVDSAVAAGLAFIITVGLQYGSAILYSRAQ